MALRIGCPSCKAVLAVGDELQGKTVRCGKCQKPMQVPPPLKPTAQVAVAPPPRPSPQASPPRQSEAIRAKAVNNQKSTVPPQNFPRAAKSEPARPPKLPPPTKSTRPIVLLVGGGLAVLGLCLFAVAGVVVAVFLAGRNSDKTVSNAEPAQQIPIKAVEKPAAQVSKKAIDQPPPPIAEPLKKAFPVKKEEAVPAAAAEQPKTEAEAPVGSPQVPTTGQLAQDVLAKVKRATVLIRVTMANGQQATGSGFFAVEPGLVLTNAHVVGMLTPGSASPQKVEIVYQSGEKDSRAFVGQVLGADPLSDLALLRVNDANLPAPLAVKNAAGLLETQVVYIFGFPLGEELGRTITVAQTTVSALRRTQSGEMSKVQVNGGMHPGNSGGPVVNSAGDVVGVAVSGIKGTQINFAVPGEKVHGVLHGRIAHLVFNAKSASEGDQVKVRIVATALDPRQRLQQVKLDHWVGSPGNSRPASFEAPAAQPGDSNRTQVEMTREPDGKFAADIVLPSLEANKVIWAQASYLNGTGNIHWSGAVSFAPKAVVAAAPSKSDTAAPAASGKEFSPKNAMFKVMMPIGVKSHGEAKVFTVDPGTKAPAGKMPVGKASAKLKISTKTIMPVETFQVSMEDNTQYVAASIAVPAVLMREIPAGSRFEVFRDIIISRAGGTVQSEVDLRQLSTDGKEFQVEMPNGHMRIQLFINGGFVLYAIAEGSSKDRINGAEANAFFDSFKLLERKPADVAGGNPAPGKGNAGNLGTNNASGPLAKVIPGELFPFLDQCVKANKLTNVDITGFKLSKDTYREVPSDGGLLIGLQVSLGKFVNNEVIEGIRPIYLTQSGEKLGAWIGKESANPVNLKAKAGYVVSGFNIRTGLQIDGFSLKFNKLAADRLDQDENYESRWVGNTKGGSPAMIGGNGAIIVGVCGHLNNGRVPCSLGVVAVGAGAQ